MHGLAFKKTDLKEAFAAKEIAIQRLNYAVDPDFIDAAIFELEAAEKRLKKVAGVICQYDIHNVGGEIVTPSGIGRYVGFNPTNGEVIVEMDFEYLVAFNGNECYPAAAENAVNTEAEEIR